MPVTSGDDKYYYCERGAGVTVYVPDTGILRSHVEFLDWNTNITRVENGINWTNDNYPYPGESVDVGTYPCGGTTPNYTGTHGTSVASVIAGRTIGVAKNATLVPIKMINCAGIGSVLNACWALDWIKDKSNPRRFNRPAVINISWYKSSFNELTSSLESVITNLIIDGSTPDGYPWKGIPVVVSANNGGLNESARDCESGDYTYPNHTSPARMAYSNNVCPAWYNPPARVISVGATDRTDHRWVCAANCLENNPGSNYGYTVDIWAPADMRSRPHPRIAHRATEC